MDQRLTQRLLASLVVCLLTCGQVSSQDIFGGRGIGTSSTSEGWGASDSSTARIGASPSWLSQKPTVKKEPLIKLPKFQFPKIQLPSFGKQNQGTGVKPSGVASWFPKRDPNQPTLFQKMNQKTKAWADKTASWFKGTSDGRTESGTPSWDQVRKEMEQIQRENAQQSADGGTVKPNFRSARGGSEPRYRY